MKKSTRKVLAGALGTLMLAATMAGCGGSTSGTATTDTATADTAATDGSSAGNHVLTVAKTGQLVGLDQHAVSDSVSLEVIATLFDGLYTLDADGNLVNAMAEDVSVSEDGLTYTFTLRDASWSNGTPVTANDFVYSWRRNVDPAIASNYNYEAVTAGIKNAEAIINGEMAPEELGVTAVDDKTLVVELDHQVPYFEAMLIRCSFMPLNQEFVESQGDNYAKGPDSIISNGPFVLTSWDYANNVSVAKNPTYWNADNIDIDELNFVTVTDSQTAAMMFESGDVDFCEISGALIDTYENAPAFSKAQEVHVAYIMPNFNNEYLQNDNLRKALALSYNKDDIANKVLRNGATPANYLVGYKLAVGPDGKDFRDSSPTYLNYDATKAAEYWEAAKKELGVDSLTLGLTYYGDDEASTSVAEYIAAQMEQNLPGLTITLDATPKKEAVVEGQEGNFDMFLFRWGPDYKDPLAFLELLKSDATYNWGSYNNPDFDNIITETKTGDLSAQSEERWDALKDAERILLDEDTGVFPVYQNGLASLINPKVHGLNVRNVGTTYNYRIVTMDD